MRTGGRTAYLQLALLDLLLLVLRFIWADQFLFGGGFTGRFGYVGAFCGAFERAARANEVASQANKYEELLLLPPTPTAVVTVVVSKA